MAVRRKGGTDISMAESLLHHFWVFSVSKQDGCMRMAEGVEIPPGYAGIFAHIPQIGRDIPGDPTLMRILVRCKNVLRRAGFLLPALHL